MARNRILITGANGTIGGKLLKQLCEGTEFDVVAVATNREKLGAVLTREGIEGEGRISFLSNEGLLAGSGDLSGIWGAVHLAFSRRVRPAADIAASITFASNVFAVLARAGIPRIINLSSQGVYGNVEEMRTERMPPAPENPYTMAKYASEVLFEAHMAESNVREYTNLRLDLVAQSQNLIRALCKQAEAGKLSLRGGQQRFSFLDVDDAAAAIIAMLRSPDGWDRVYNVGWNRCRYTLVEVAEIVAEAAEELGIGRPEIELDESQDIRLWAGMDSSRFMEKTGWKPCIDLMHMVRGMMQMQ